MNRTAKQLSPAVTGGQTADSRTVATVERQSVLPVRCQSTGPDGTRVSLDERSTTAPHPNQPSQMQPQSRPETRDLGCMVGEGGAWDSLIPVADAERLVRRVKPHEKDRFASGRTGTHRAGDSFQTTPNARMEAGKHADAITDMIKTEAKRGRHPQQLRDWQAPGGAWRSYAQVNQCHPVPDCALTQGMTTEPGGEIFGPVQASKPMLERRSEECVSGQRHDTRPRGYGDSSAGDRRDSSGGGEGPAACGISQCTIAFGFWSWSGTERPFALSGHRGVIQHPSRNQARPAAELIYPRRVSFRGVVRRLKAIRRPHQSVTPKSLCASF